MKPDTLVPPPYNIENMLRFGRRLKVDDFDASNLSTNSIYQRRAKYLSFHISITEK